MISRLDEDAPLQNLDKMIWNNKRKETAPRVEESSMQLKRNDILQSLRTPSDGDRPMAERLYFGDDAWHKPGEAG